MSEAAHNIHVDMTGTEMAKENIVAGMDLGKLESFRTALRENPITLGLKARAVWEGHSGRSTVHIGPYDRTTSEGSTSTVTRGITHFHTGHGERSRRRSGS